MKQTSPSPRRLARSIWAILAGILINFLATPIDGLLHAVHFYSNTAPSMTHAQAAVALSYRLMLAVVGAWVTARLSPRKPMAHAMILAGVGTVISTLGAIAMLSVKGYGPAWYSLALIAACFPMSWLGARLHRS